MAGGKLQITRHHPQIGYTYMPNMRKRVAAGGSGYLIQTNSTGFRSNHEFVPERHAGTQRVLLFGDSQTAGDWVSNGKRFSDLIEERVPDLEIYNYGVTGTGTDQQYMIYQEYCQNIDNDLIVICIFVENILRVNKRIFVRPNPEGEIQYYPKPHYTLEAGRLVKGGVPVPQRPWGLDNLPEAYHGLVSELDGAVPDPSRTWAPTLRRLLPQAALRHFIPFVRRFVRNRALPHYDRANTAEWQLLRHILKAWIAESRSPVLVVPIPLAQFILRSGDDGPCRARYNELAAETGCDFYDPLPDFWRLDENVRQALWNHKNGHFTDKGHEVLADLLQPHIAAALERKAVA